MFKTKTILSYLAALVTHGSGRATQRLDVQLFNLVKDSDEINLIDVLENMPAYFNTSVESSFPESFEFPRNFEYSVAFGKVTVGDKKRKRIFEGSQQVIFDDQNNRVRIEREMRIFHEKDKQVKLYEFDKMQLLVSDPDKKVCLKHRIVDTSPVSMIPHDKDQIVIADAL